MTTSSSTASPHNLAFPLNINGTMGSSTTYSIAPTFPATAIYTITGYGGGGGRAGAANVFYNDSDDLNTNAITVKGQAEIQGTLSIGKDILMKGKSLESRLAEIETRLAILHHNPELETKWEGLRKLGEEYRIMEKDVIEKEKIWAILRGPDIPY